MNTHIEKSALDCGAWHQVYDQKRFMVNKNFDVEKFAELIVRECVDVARDYDGDKLSGPGMIIANRVQEYFGVHT